MELEKKLIDLQLFYCADYTKIGIQADYVKLDYLKKMLELERNDEPSKLLKKKHKAWEDEINRLEKEFFETTKQIGEQAKDLDDIYSTLKG